MMLRPPVLSALAILLGSTLLAGCSGSTEDVRITFCKNLASTQLSLSENADWQPVKPVVKHQEDAQVTVRAKNAGRVTCWFEYEDAAEEAAADPDSLDPFSTLPYQISVNGKLLSARAALDAVNAEQIRMGRAAVEKLREAAYR